MSIARKITELRVLGAIVRFSKGTSGTNIDDLHLINLSLLKAANSKEQEKFTNILFEYPEFKELYESPRPEKHDLDRLRKLPTNTLGYCYAKFMDDNNLSIDWYPRVKEVLPLHFAYNRQYDVHDILHVLTGFGVEYGEELGLQGFYVTQTAPNPTAMASIASAALNRLKTNDPDKNLLMIEYLFAGYQMGKIVEKIMFRNWEDDFATDIDQLRAELKIVPYDKSLPPLS
jgi:ubiquinone biosynthesis protein COQ4